MTKRYFSRQEQGESFRYFGGSQEVTDAAQLKRIKSLVVPPAWSRVRIARTGHARVQVSGYDSAGR